MRPAFEKVTPGYANTDEGYEQFLASRKVDSSPLRISEVMSANVTTLTDDYGAYSDYVEVCQHQRQRNRSVWRWAFQ